MWGGRLSVCFACLARLELERLHVTCLCSYSEDCSHGDHDEQLGEGLGEYGGAHEARFGVPVVRQALCAERDDGVDDEGVAGDGAEGYGDAFRSAHHLAEAPCGDSCEDCVGEVESGESGNELCLVEHRRGVGGAHESKEQAHEGNHRGIAHGAYSFVGLLALR